MSGARADKFLRGALILTAAGLMVKVIGSVNRILLSRLLGGEGIGLYQMAYPVYLLLLAVSSAGIPVAISLIVAEYVARRDYGSVQRVFRISLAAMAAVGLLLAAALLAAAGWLVDTGIIRDGRAYYGLVALTPAIFFATILASFRGFFQGHQLMTPPAVSQIAEQLVRVCTMLALAYLLLPEGLEYAAAGAAFGAVPGSLTGILVLSGFYWYYRKKWRSGALAEAVGAAPVTAPQLLKRLLLLALPVSCANILVPVTSSIDMLLVPNRLAAAGFSVSEATTLFGYLAGMAQPLLMMATIPTMSLAASLVPAVSTACVLGNREELESKAAMAMKLCCLLTLPAAVGMSALAKPISLLLYGTAAAGAAIMHSGPAIWLLGLQQVTTGILQGMGKTRLPMLNMLAGIAAKTAAVWLLTDAEWNIAGAAWATNINFALTALLNLAALYAAGISFPWARLLRIMAAALLMGIVSRQAYGLLLEPAGATVASLAALALAVLFYILLLPAFKIVSRQELRQLALLKKFVK